MASIQHSWLDEKNFVITSDSIPFLEHCANHHFTTKDLMQTESLPQNSLVFSFSDIAAKKTFELARLSSRKRCIFFPIHAFENSVKNAT